MSKKQTENKTLEAKVNTDFFNKFIDTPTNREFISELYCKVFGFYNVPLNGSDDILRDCIQQLKDYYKID